MRELRRHQRESAQSPFVFVSERGAPLSAPGFSRMIERVAIAADLGIKAHAHMLVMPAAISWRTMATTRARSKPISGIATSRIRRAIPRWRRSGLRSVFGIESAADRGSGAEPGPGLGLTVFPRGALTLMAIRTPKRSSPTSVQDTIFAR